MTKLVTRKSCLEGNLHICDASRGDATQWNLWFIFFQKKHFSSVVKGSCRQRPGGCRGPGARRTQIYGRENESWGSWLSNEPKVEPWEWIVEKLQSCNFACSFKSLFWQPPGSETWRYYDFGILFFTLSKEPTKRRTLLHWTCWHSPRRITTVWFGRWL